MWSAGIGEIFPRHGSPTTYFVVWGSAVFANFEKNGRASPLIHTLYFSLLEMGFLAWLISVIVGLIRRVSAVIEVPGTSRAGPGTGGGPLPHLSFGLTGRSSLLGRLSILSGLVSRGPAECEYESQSEEVCQ